MNPVPTQAPIQPHPTAKPGAQRARPPRGNTQPRPPRGFTLVELVLVIVLLGILAVVAVPRLNTGDFDEYAYAEETLAALRYARQTAVARNTTVKVSFAGNHWRICTGSPCAPLKNPANGKPWDGSAPGQGQAPAGVTIASGAAEISFNGLGSASAATTIVIGGTRHVRINSETGHVQAL